MKETIWKLKVGIIYSLFLLLLFWVSESAWAVSTSQNEQSESVLNVNEMTSDEVLQYVLDTLEMNLSEWESIDELFTNLESVGLQKEDLFNLLEKENVNKDELLNLLEQKLNLSEEEKRILSEYLDSIYKEAPEPKENETVHRAWRGTAVGSLIGNIFLGLLIVLIIVL